MKLAIAHEESTSHLAICGISGEIIEKSHGWRILLKRKKRIFFFFGKSFSGFFHIPYVIDSKYVHRELTDFSGLDFPALFAT